VGHASDLSFSPDGALLVVAGGSYLKVFDATNGSHAFAGAWQPLELFSLAFSDDGQWLVTFAPSASSALFAGGASVLQVTDPAQGHTLELGQDVHAAGFSSDSTLLALALASPTARLELYSVPSFELVSEVNQSDLAQSSTFSLSTDGRLLTYQGTITFRTSTGALWFGPLVPPFPQNSTIRSCPASPLITTSR
jgi:WD40 repeat protein